MKLNQIIQGDCLEVMRDMPDGCFDWVITDPPYPDYHAELYQYHDGILDFLNELPCRQLIFWSAKVPFPLDYTAIHIWDKVTGAGAHYERLFERNGGKSWKVFRCGQVSSSVDANFVQDVWTKHPSQKPRKLMERLIEDYTKPGDTILDPFCGSGSTLVAAERLGRKWLGIELSPEYCEIARRRTAQKGLF